MEKINSEKRICAPVIIPTLSRFVHLKECIASLQKNNLAIKTELFISVDFPPSEKYKEGYEKVIDYLQCGIDGFKKVNIYYQEENLGPNENTNFLKREALKQYDRFIYTEDDNIFSSNYLEYMNQCLDKYQDDKEVYAISGYSYPINWGENKNAIIRESLYFSAWGYGIWENEYIQEQKFTKHDIFLYLKDLNNAIKMYQNSRKMFNEAVYIASGKHYLAFLDNGELYHMDVVQGIYMYIFRKKMIMPFPSKVRNVGYDGSGQNCKKASKNDNTSDWYNYLGQEMDKSSEFDLNKSAVVDITSSHVKHLNKFFNVSHKTMIKTWIIWFLKIWLRKDI